MAGLQIDSIFIRIVGDSTIYINSLNEAKKASEQFGSSVASALVAPFLAIGIPLAAVGKVGVDAFSRFDKAMTESISIMNVTDEQISRMKKTALDLSTQTKFRPEDLAKAYYHLASSGMNAEQAIAALPAVARFATAGAFDLEKATMLASTSQSAIGMRAAGAKDNLATLTRIMDVLTKANILAEGNVRDFSVALSRQAAAASRFYGKSLEETVATLMVFGQQNIKAQVAGTNYSMVLRHLSKQSIKNRKEHNALGLSMYDAQGNLKNMADIAENFEKVFGNMSPELRSAAMLAAGFDARIQQAIFPLIGFSKQIRNFQTQLEGAGGIMTKVADKQMSAFDNQMMMIKNTINVTAVEIGSVLAPSVLAVAGVVRDLASWFNSLPSSVTTAVVAVGAFTAGFALLTVGIIVAGKAFNLMFGGIGILAGVAITSLFALSAAMGGTVAYMGGFGKTIEYVKQKWVEFKNWMEPITNAIGSFMGTMWTGFKQIGVSVMNSVTTFVLNSLNAWVTIIGRTFGLISNNSNMTWTDVRDGIATAILFSEWLFMNFGDNVKLVMAGLRYYTLATASKISDIYNDLINGKLNVSFLNMFTNFQRVSMSMVTVSGNAVTKMASRYSSLFNAIGQYVKGDYVAAFNTVQQLLNSTNKKMEEVKAPKMEKNPEPFDLKSMEKAWKDEFERLKNKMKTSWEDFRDQKLSLFKGRKILDTQKNMGPFKDAMDNVVDVSGDAADKIKDQWKAAAENGLGRFEAAAWRSAEAISRLEEYRLGVLGKAGGRIRHRGFGGEQPPPDVGGQIIKKNKMPQIIPGQKPPQAPNPAPPAPNEVLPPPMMEMDNNQKDVVKLLEEIKNRLGQIRDKRFPNIDIPEELALS